MDRERERLFPSGLADLSLSLRGLSERFFFSTLFDFSRVSSRERDLRSLDRLRLRDRSDPLRERRRELLERDLDRLREDRDRDLRERDRDLEECLVLTLSSISILRPLNDLPLNFS